MKLIRLLILFIFFVSLVSAQTVLDSADIILKLKEDTSKVNYLSRLTGAYINTGNYDTALKTAGIMDSLSKKLNYTVGEALSKNLTGNVYMYQARYSQALEQYFTSLKLAEKAKRPRNIANAYTNIGIIYDYIKEFNKSLQYLHKALFIHSVSGHTPGIANVSNSIGNLFREVMPDSALFYFNKALELRRLLKDKKGEAGALNNIGLCYMNLGNTIKALDYYKASLEIKKEINDITGICNTTGNIAVIFKSEKKFKEAIKYYLECYEIADKTGNLSMLLSCSEGLSICYENTNKPGEALRFYKIAVGARDSIYNETATKTSIQTEMNYEFEKKEMARKAEEEKKETIAREEKRRQKLITITVSIAFAAALLVTALISWSLIQNKKKNKIITSQNSEIERKNEQLTQKNKEIVDSIQYAKRIQQALLPTEKYIEKNLDKYKTP
jgi:tetratricopeptide (TPR) repeat protein